MFYFKLHPLQYEFEGDGEQLYRALALADGRYLISWSTKSGHYEFFMSAEDILASLSNENWVIVEASESSMNN